MIDPVRELKIRAELLQHGIAAGSAPATERLRALPELRRASAEQRAAFAAGIQRKHCLATVARELGFQGWDHASRVLRGDDDADQGELLCPRAVGSFLNDWFATYDEAHAAHVEGGGYLLAYRRQSFVTGREYVASTLGLDPDDGDWTAIGFDWRRPRDPEARRRLCAKLLSATRGAA